MTDIHTISEDGFNAAVVAASLTNEHTADTVDILNRLEPEEAAEVLRLLPRERAIEVLDKPELDFAAEIVEALPHDVAIPLLAGMSADMAADLIQQLRDPPRTELMEGLDPASRNAIKSLLAYPANTAGAMMTIEFVSAPSNWTVERTLQPTLDATRSFATVTAAGAPVEEVWPIDRAALQDRGALAVACDSLGVGEAMLHATVAYAKVRTQFDQPIGSFQAVKHQCADMLVQLTIGRALLDDAVASLDPVAASRAKAFLGQAAVDVAGTAMQLHGGIGYTWESDVHVFLKRAILNRVWFGTPAEHRRRVAAGIVRR